VHGIATCGAILGHLLVVLCQVCVQLLLVPDLHIDAELLRCLVEFPSIGTAVNGMEFLLAIVDAEGVVEEDVLEDSVKLANDKVDGRTVPNSGTSSITRPLAGYD
jgi:hypothetical protein